MRNIGSRNKIKDWARLAAKLAFVLTEPKVRAAIGDHLKDRADYVTDTLTSKYEDAVDRLGAAGAALQGRSYWPSRVMGFVLGVGVGAGLGILLAPAAGSETREAIRGKAVDMKNKVAESASTATDRIRQSVTSMPSTGSEG
ncbi:MAG: YtxH domain-containing protein [Terriglobales bacterium]